ncbi:ABC transporter ATP-binding protein [Luteolibacter yonseiensis]|uniref:ABC transporter ATP-binding protein n=1 Tax=Luteolibacter yonseiensis TaxID=1144680 RepID=A0A934R5I4_9BACT|nr:ABC transporter ATP-binding protein [Luteolibacter yonseiensis]MBK1815635.1 ABC transporter ATP-binding protein [Luteolibacter yonseiensis]
MKPLLEFHQVTCRFSRSWALRHASFHVPAGSITALLGPNGAGKSTALKIALNLIRPSSGHVEILGVDSRKLGPAQLARIGYVADGMELPDWMSVDQFLAWCRPLYPKWDPDLERSLRKQFSLPGDRKLSHLSRGQRMKAALIAALSYRPELLVLDEPFSGLDPVVRDEFITGLLEIAGGEGLSVVVSSHDIEEVDRLADHVVLLNHGAVVLNEGTEPLLARHRRVEILLPPDLGELPQLPANWISPQSAGRVLRFTDTGHEPEKLARALSALFPGSPPAGIHPLGLRELFVTLVREGRADSGI